MMIGARMHAEEGVTNVLIDAPDEDLLRIISSSRDALVGSASVEALRILSQRHTTRLFSLTLQVLGGLGTHEEAEEVVSDTLVTVWKEAPHYQVQEGVPAFAWIRRIHLNRALARRRALVRRVAKNEPLTDRLEDATGSTLPAVDNDALERRLDMETALGELRVGYPADADLLESRYFRNREPSEIASDLGITTNAVRVRIHRALHRLRLVLEGQSSLDRNREVGIASEHRPTDSTLNFDRSANCAENT